MGPALGQLTLPGGALLAAGVLAAGLGLYLLRRARQVVTSPSAAGPSPAVLLSRGLLLLVLAYHLVVWAFPPQTGVLAVPADRWWLLILILGVLAAAATAIDRLESARDRSP